MIQALTKHRSRNPACLAGTALEPFRAKRLPKPCSGGGGQPAENGTKAEALVGSKSNYTAFGPPKAVPHGRPKRGEP